MLEPEEQFPDAELSRMLASIDHPLPTLRASDVIGRARGRAGRRSAFLAAAAVLMVASVATATVPGSYLRRYLQQLMTGSSTAQPVRQTAGAPASEEASRGIAFAPGPQVDVEFRAEQTTGAVQVRWADVGTVVLSQTGSSGSAHYALTPGGVIVDNGGSTASYSLVFPRTIERALVRVAGRLVLSKDGETVSCAGTRDDTGSCVIEVAAATVARSSAVRGHPHLITVRMVDQPNAKFAFQPADIVAERGDTVRFVQGSTAPHNVAFRARPKQAKLGAAATGPYVVTVGQTYDLAIDQRFPDGKYTFVCDPHSAIGMQGTLEVRTPPR